MCNYVKAADRLIDKRIYSFKLDCMCMTQEVGLRTLSITMVGISHFRFALDFKIETKRGHKITAQMGGCSKF